MYLWCELIIYNQFSLCVICCSADFFELISRAQANRMDDQRGELKGNLELPDFLKIPVNSKQAQGNENFKVPYAPPPPQGFRTVDRNVPKPALKKTLSTPVGQPPEKMDLMQELAAKLSKRTEPTKNSSSPKDKAERQDEQNEILLDYNFNSRTQPQQEQTSQAVVNAAEKHRRAARPRSCTDATLYTTMETAHGMRVETGNRPHPVADAEPRKNVAHVHPSIRPQASQPVTVNSLRGMHYATNPRRNTADHAMYYRPNNAASGKPQTAARVSSKSHQNLRDTTPAIYDVKPGSNQEGLRNKGYDNHSVKYSTAPVNIPTRRLVSAYSLPEVNSKKAEVHIPSAGGPPPVPQRTVSYMERRPRPKPITDPEELLAGLENMPVSRSNASPSDRVESPPHPEMTRVGSPLPPPPTPPSGSVYDLQLADFSPPPSICESPEKTPHPPEYRDSSSFAQSSASQSGAPFPSSTTSQSRTNSGNAANYSGPVAYVNMPGKDVQRQRTGDNRSVNYSKVPITPHVRITNANASIVTNSTHRVRGEDRVDASSAQVHTPGSVTPTLSNLNKTVTPPSTNERTLVEEPPSENATPYTGHKPSMDNTAKRLIHNTGSVPRTRNTDLEKRKSRQDSEIPKLDPYVTYEKEDLRITFV